jgi:ribosomal protein S18 acetylase RimI-like enzyme
MIINNNQSRYNNTFTSLRIPVKSFDVKTSGEVLHFSEVNYKHIPKNSFYKKLAEFFLENFANTSGHPFWTKCRKPTLDEAVYNDYIKGMAKNYKSSINNPYTTIMLAKNKSKKIVAAIFARPLRETSKIKDSGTLYVDSIAVAPEYRGSNIGYELLNRLMNTSKKRFTDVFLVAYKESQPFYEKLGFRPMSLYRNDSERFVIEEMAKERKDYPQFAEFMTKFIYEKGCFDWCSRINFRNIPKD